MFAVSEEISENSVRIADPRLRRHPRPDDFGGPVRQIRIMKNPIISSSSGSGGSDNPRATRNSVGSDEPKPTRFSVEEPKPTRFSVGPDDRKPTRFSLTIAPKRPDLVGGSEIRKRAFEDSNFSKAIIQKKPNSIFDRSSNDRTSRDRTANERSSRDRSTPYSGSDNNLYFGRTPAEAAKSRNESPNWRVIGTKESATSRNDGDGDINDGQRKRFKLQRGPLDKPILTSTRMFDELMKGSNKKKS